MFWKSDEQKEADRNEYIYNLGRAEGRNLIRLGFSAEAILEVAITDDAFDKGLRFEASRSLNDML